MSHKRAGVHAECFQKLNLFLTKKQRFTSGFCVLSVTAHRQALVSKKQKPIAENSSLGGKPAREHSPTVEFNSAVFVCVIKYISAMKTPTISLPRKMELLFLNVGGINIPQLCCLANADVPFPQSHLQNNGIK